ncbi:hypothetical protein NLI96_g6915 [Meripilus lineatus]|uniref:Lysine-specific metallo-endopeptidase domain-containing protein n=1 Tax=Meripilus lineatus TaxID=2056292 RepID=A0AAD5V009_9APHY|nr:hypothetical protein NLI96_g6915 [Physisporinus lineatus]
MRFTYSTVLLILTVVQVGLSVPLGIQYDKDPKKMNKQEKSNKNRFDTAQKDANKQISAMRKGIDKFHAGDPEATQYYEAAFGKNGVNSDSRHVDANIQRLENGKIKVKTATHKMPDSDMIAAVPYTPPAEGSSSQAWTAKDAVFGEKFHGGINRQGRAGTLIHEATHQISRLGDHVGTDGNIITRRPEDNGKPKSALDGYTNNPNGHKTVHEVAHDTDFTAVRNNAKNMHDNSDSYTLFGSLCSQPGALSRRDFDLYNQALFERDHAQLLHIARRNSCQLPKDYFAKKAAAKKAAEAKGNKTPQKAPASGGSRGMTVMSIRCLVV